MDWSLLANWVVFCGVLMCVLATLGAVMSLFKSIGAKRRQANTKSVYQLQVERVANSEDERLNVPWSLGQDDRGHGHYSYAILVRDQNQSHPQRVILEAGTIGELPEYIVALHNQRLGVKE